VWQKEANGSITVDIVDPSGAVVDPGTVGIAAPVVDPNVARSQEPEAWVQHGSVVICINIEQFKGCMTFND